MFLSQTQVPIKKVLEKGPKESFDNGYAGIGAAVWSKNAQEYLSFYHAEDHLGMPGQVQNPDVPGFYGSIGLAVSKDGYKLFQNRTGHHLQCSEARFHDGEHGSRGCVGVC